LNLLPLLLSFAQVAIIDDDADYVDSLAFSIPSQFNASLHVAPSTFDEVMRVSSANLQLEQQRFYSIVETQLEFGGRSLPLVLRYLSSPIRFEITAVAMADYSMPIEDGVSLMTRHKYLGLQRILLTGQADNGLAVNAFNAGAIEMFLPKQSPDLLHKIRDGLELHLKASAAIRGQLLSRALPTALAAALVDKAVVHKVVQYLASMGVVEYVMLGRPMGFVAIRADGSPLWIQIEDETSLAGLAELLEESNWPPAEVENVKARGGAVCIEWANQIPGFKATYESLHQVSEEPYLGLASFPLNDLPLDLRPLSHHEWQREHGHPRDLRA
jgi:CheY-like chemotaxis protein